MSHIPGMERFFTSAPKCWFSTGPKETSLRRIFNDEVTSNVLDELIPLATSGKEFVPPP